MKPFDLPVTAFQEDLKSAPDDRFGRRAAGPPPTTDGVAPRIDGMVIGELLALVDNGTTPLVVYPGLQGSAALRARTIVDLHGPHIRASVALMFEDGDPCRPIVMGIVRNHGGWPTDQKPSQVDVDVDGARMVVSANEQLVLRCGKASITLTKDGKVLIEGSHLLSRSSGVNLIKGSSIELN